MIAALHVVLKFCTWQVKGLQGLKLSVYVGSGRVGGAEAASESVEDDEDDSENEEGDNDGDEAEASDSEEESDDEMLDIEKKAKILDADRCFLKSYTTAECICFMQKALCVPVYR